MIDILAMPAKWVNVQELPGSAQSAIGAFLFEFGRDEIYRSGAPFSQIHLEQAEKKWHSSAELKGMH
jgi:hypothetical protein